MKIKVQLENCMITVIVIYDTNTDKVYFCDCSDHVCEWLEERENGIRKVSHYYVIMNRLYIAVE